LSIICFSSEGVPIKIIRRLIIGIKIEVKIEPIFAYWGRTDQYTAMLYTKLKKHMKVNTAYPTKKSNVKPIISTLDTGSFVMFFMYLVIISELSLHALTKVITLTLKTFIIAFTLLFNFVLSIFI
jgi:hypothetical protein